MTTEEKARAYDEALKKAKEIKEKIMYSHLSTESCKAVSEYIDTIIPELAESEDERIRKKIIENVRLSGGYTDEEIDEMISWLEKQKEQKPSHKFNVGDTIHCKYDDREFAIKSVDLANGVYKYTKEGCGNDIDYADENFELVEQKPAEWSEEDEK